MSKFPHTWSGPDLRLIDLLHTEERKAVIGFLPESERRFYDRHVTGDAAEFLKNADKHRVIDNYDELVNLKHWPKMLETLGHVVTTGMDGRRAVVKLGDPTPLRGTVPPGAASDSQIAQEFVRGLQADGIAVVYPVTQRATKIVFVSKEFAEYLRANGEAVQAFGGDSTGIVPFVWPARSDAEVKKFAQNFQLAQHGANAPDSGELAKIVAAKAPKQFAAWKTGVADQWRMLDALRELVLEGSKRMTAGAFADAGAGAELAAGLKALQAGFQQMAEDALSGEPRRATAEHINEVGTRLLSVGLYLKEAEIKEPAVARLVTDAVDLAATIADELMALVARRELAANRTMNQSIDVSAGLG